MRIFEIDGTNEIWAKFNNVPLDISDKYRSMVNIVKLVIRNNSPALSPGYQSMFDTFEQSLIVLINGSWPDPLDQDVIDLVADAKQKLAEFRALRAQIK